MSSNLILAEFFHWEMEHRKADLKSNRILGREQIYYKRLYSRNWSTVRSLRLPRCCSWLYYKYLDRGCAKEKIEIFSQSQASMHAFNWLQIENRVPRVTVPCKNFGTFIMQKANYVWSSNCWCCYAFLQPNTFVTIKNREKQLKEKILRHNRKPRYKIILNFCMAWQRVWKNTETGERRYSIQTYRNRADVVALKRKGYRDLGRRESTKEWLARKTYFAVSLQYTNSFHYQSLIVTTRMLEYAA